jgi:hypothetical protein
MTILLSLRWAEWGGFDELFDPSEPRGGPPPNELVEKRDFESSFSSCSLLSA